MKSCSDSTANMPISTSGSFSKKNWRQRRRMQKQKIDPAKAQQTFTIIWFALLFSQFLFLVLIYVGRPEVFRFDLSRPVLGENAVVILVLAIVSLTDLAISFVMRKKYLDQAI